MHRHLQLRSAHQRLKLGLLLARLSPTKTLNKCARTRAVGSILEVGRFETCRALPLTKTTGSGLGATSCIFGIPKSPMLTPTASEQKTISTR